jgi:hypothetical protein
VYGVRRLERFESDIRYAEQRRVVCQYDFYADVYGCRWFGIAERIGNAASGTDADADRIADECSIGRVVDPDVEFDECNELRGVGRLDGHEGDHRHSEHWCVVCEQ